MYLYGDYNLICLGIIYRIWIMLGSSALVTVVHGSHTSWTDPKNQTLVGRGKVLLKKANGCLVYALKN